MGAEHAKIATGLCDTAVGIHVILMMTDSSFMYKVRNFLASVLILDGVHRTQRILRWLHQRYMYRNPVRIVVRESNFLKG